MKHPAITERNRKLGETVVRALKSRFFDAVYCDTAEEAVSAALSMIPTGAGVTFGGSMTIRDTGLITALKEGGRIVYDRDEIPASERRAFVESHFFSDWFLGSTNALTEDGVLLNMDGIGNRVAAMIYGPRNVLLMVGINKVVQNFDAAVARVRDLAAPVNAQRFDIDTPCRKTGKCADCKFPDSICSSMTVMRLSHPAGRVKVILFGEEAGF